MPIPAFRTKQTTSTTGTGTLTLNAASAEFRSFAVAFGGSSVKVRYVLQRAGAAVEVGYGVFNGSNQLTRDAVVWSTNSSTFVSLGAGETDVFFDFLPGDRQHYNVTGTTTLALADIGCFVRCTPSANMTLNLPAVATVPPGQGYLIKNDGTNFAVIYIDPNGSETLEGQSQAFPLFAGEAIEIYGIGNAWRAGLRPSGWRLASRATANAVASVDFILPVWVTVGRSEYRAEWRHVRLADGASLCARSSSDGGTSYDAGTDNYDKSEVLVLGANSVAGFSNTEVWWLLSADMDLQAGHTIHGYAQIFPGAGGARYGSIYGQSIARGNGLTYAGWQTMIFGGARRAAADVTAIRFLASTGNIALGEFDLFAKYD